MNRLARLIEKVSTIRAVATLKRFPGEVAGFREDTQEVCETTWTAPQQFEQTSSQPGATVHIYVRTTLLTYAWKAHRVREEPPNPACEAGLLEPP